MVATENPIAASCGRWRRRAIWLAVAVAAVLLIVGVVLVLRSSAGPAAIQSSRGIGGPFTLTASTGQRIADQSFRGKWLLVYFGYTHCPDICPTTLTEIGETLDRLGPLAAEIQPFFISIDPERDTPAAMGDYLQSFDPRIIGLSGTPAEIAAVAKEFRVYYARQQGTGSGDSYLMEHTAFVYLIGPDGAYVTLFSPLQGQSPDDVASRLRELISRRPG